MEMVKCVFNTNKMHMGLQTIRIKEKFVLNNFSAYLRREKVSLSFFNFQTGCQFYSEAGRKRPMC